MLVERLFDRQLERRARCRTAVAAALQNELRDPLLDPDQLDVATVGLHVRAHRVKRLDHPLLETYRIQIMDQQQARDRAILG